MIYLDYAASFPPFSEVVVKMGQTAATAYANPGAIHSAGSAGRAQLQQSRKTLARLLQVRPEEVFFTSGGTESNNWAVKMACAGSSKKHIVCATSEHKSVLASVQAIASSGCTVTWLNPDRQGLIRLEAVQAALRPDTALLCVQAVNNETGVLQDVDGLAALARSRGVLYFCDAVQSFGHVSQNLHKADLFSLSAHKFGGPRGIGCLVVRYPNRLSPLIHGGGQEFGLRSGTENLPGIAGLSLAAELANAQRETEAPRLQLLRSQLEEGLRRICPGLLIAGEGAPRSPGILCCAFPGHTGEELTIRLDQRGICVSPGAACSAQEGGPSHVLLSMGYLAGDAARFVRFSLGPQTTEEDIQYTLQAISDLVS